MARNISWAKLAMLMPNGRQTPPGFDFTTNVMHVDTDAICPRCFAWIAPHDIVRRTAYGLLQHEACPVTAQPEVVSELST
ncbi:MAG TPA: hypothetical protein VME70_01280 [Mycobacteriales bacterium]|nr:hypothetical protein [Mycobacteriales bacterium]